MQDFYIIRTLLFAAAAFVFTMAWTPLLTHFLYKHKLGKHIRNDGDTPIFSRLHQSKSGTPTMGGILVWGTALVFCLFFYYLAYLFPFELTAKLNFLSRSQTLLILGCLVASALVGLLDDYLDARRLGYKQRGIKFRDKLVVYAVIASVGAWWFYFKLDWDLIHVPFLGTFNIGAAYIVFFIAVVTGTAFAVNQTDGLDGLAGGTLLMAFGSYAVISIMIGRYDLATLCGVIVGALLAFLWFNINPARFFMGDTGSMSLGITLALIAMYTHTAFFLPFIGFIFLIEAASTVIQILSRKFRQGRKVWLSTPIHHHFEAKGWSEPKIVMRFWVIAGVMSSLGIVLFLLDKTW